MVDFWVDEQGRDLSSMVDGRWLPVSSWCYKFLKVLFGLISMLDRRGNDGNPLGLGCVLTKKMHRRGVKSTKGAVR